MVLRMTRAEYYARHSDFRSERADGTLMVLHLDSKSGATVLAPVELVDGPGTYRYELKGTRQSSRRFGPCGVCGGDVVHVHYQTELRSYVRPDGSIGWTGHGCRNLYGHAECLESIRRAGERDSCRGCGGELEDEADVLCFGCEAERGLT